jgi:uncharacterized membrane protein YdcZ (DUF606 family)
MNDLNIKNRLASVEVILFGSGVLFCTVPLQMMTKMASGGLLPSFAGIKFSSFEILPLYAVGNVLANAAFLTLSGWWRNISVTKRLGITIPKIRWYIFISGICTVGQIFSAIWAYAYGGASLAVVSILMKGGVLMLAPIVDVIAKKRRRKIYWPSLVAAVLSFLALMIASVQKANSNITLICALDVALYLFVHSIKLSIMSRWAKSEDKRERRQYIIEEQIVISIVLTSTLLILGIIGSGMSPDSALNQVWSGYAVLPAKGFVLMPMSIGVAAVGMGIFQSLIFLDRRENTFCVAIIQSSGIISGFIVTYLLSVFYNQPRIGTNEIVSAAIVVCAISFLSYRGAVEKMSLRKTCPKVILLVGPSACGKSLFSKHFREAFPDYEMADDRYLVEEYLKKNNLSEIKDPRAWDEIIVSLAKSLNPDKKYIVEFARGHDPKYLAAFGIAAKDVYPRSISLASKAMPHALANSMGIIHVTCDYRLRLRRNAARRNITKQDLPDSVLERVFKEDVFEPEYIDECSNRLRRGFFNKSIPVVTIDNDQDIPEKILSEHFKSLSIQTMDILVKRGNV